MTDSGIKKAKVLKSDLPNFLGSETSLFYKVRYRVVSEDKNRYSHWSQFHEIVTETTADEVGYNPASPTTTSIPHSVIVTKPSHLAEISWTMPALLISSPTDAQKILQAKQSSIKQFDVYVSWKVSGTWSPWSYVGNSESNKKSIAYSATTTATEIKFAVQKVTLNKERYSAATYLETIGYAL
jgi:hypothetical protein